MDQAPARILVAVMAYNEGQKLRELTSRFPDGADYQVLFVDDGSDDGTWPFLQQTDFASIRHETNLGVGAGIRDAIAYGRAHKFDLIVIMAANGKMLPEEIPRLVAPLTSGQADYVQGSRYLKGGRSPNLPTFRRVMIKAFTKMVNLVTGWRGTDITCGFRAYRLDILAQPDIDLTQEWLGRYEMEYYIHYKVLKHHRRIVEVPVSMVYPTEGEYSKIKPLTGWWSMIRPWIFLTLRLKK